MQKMLQALSKRNRSRHDGLQNKRRCSLMAMQNTQYYKQEQRQRWLRLW